MGAPGARNQEYGRGGTANPGNWERQGIHLEKKLLMKAGRRGEYILEPSLTKK
jgi:hypothetical protein